MCQRKFVKGHVSDEICPRNLSEIKKQCGFHFGLYADRIEYESDRFRIGSYLDRIHLAMDSYCIGFVSDRI